MAVDQGATLADLNAELCANGLPDHRTLTAGTAENVLHVEADIDCGGAAAWAQRTGSAPVGCAARCKLGMRCFADSDCSPPGADLTHASAHVCRVVPDDLRAGFAAPPALEADAFPREAPGRCVRLGHAQDGLRSLHLRLWLWGLDLPDAVSADLSALLPGALARALTAAGVRAGRSTHPAWQQLISLAGLGDGAPSARQLGSKPVATFTDDFAAGAAKEAGPGDVPDTFTDSWAAQETQQGGEKGENSPLAYFTDSFSPTWAAPEARALQGAAAAALQVTVQVQAPGAGVSDADLLALASSAVDGGDVHRELLAAQPGLPVTRVTSNANSAGVAEVGAARGDGATPSASPSPSPEPAAAAGSGTSSKPSGMDALGGLAGVMGIVAGVVVIAIVVAAVLWQRRTAPRGRFASTAARAVPKTGAAQSPAAAPRRPSVIGDTVNPLVSAGHSGASTRSSRMSRIQRAQGPQV